MNNFEYSFQVDSEIVKRQRTENDNYIIEYDEKASNRNKCAVYFSSHDIYFPNQESSFRFSILEKNHYEWRNCRIPDAYKHIFLRDVNKQWYLSGINDRIDSPQKLLEFLRKETDGYDVVTVGSSAGGYAAVLYGMQIENTERILAFSPRFTMSSLATSSPVITPLYHRLKDRQEFQSYMDIKQFIKSGHAERIFYFVGVDSELDKVQIAHLGNDTDTCIIKFNTRRHGIPFPKVALPRVFGMTNEELMKYADQTHHPLAFSIKLVGLRKTFLGVYKQMKNLIVKKYKRTIKARTHIG